MKKLKILLTGDDGYQSDGIQILINVLRNDYDLKIAGTKNQRSATGGGLILGGGKWGKDKIDGIEALWVDTNPANAVEVAKYYYKTDFDLVISGINYGPNIGSCNASGTVGAALRGLALDMTNKSIAFSWQLPSDFWAKHHTKDQILDQEYQYPGEIAKKIVDLALKQNLWGADMLNINFPEKNASEIIFTKPVQKELINYYQSNLKILNNGTYIDTDFTDSKVIPTDDYDIGVLAQDKISVVPWLSNLYLNQELLDLFGKKIKL